MLDRSNWLILGLAVVAATLGGVAQHRHARGHAVDTRLLGRPAPDVAMTDSTASPTVCASTADAACC